MLWLFAIKKDIVFYFLHYFEFVLTVKYVLFAIFFQKLDPTQFLRVYGRPYKINLDPAIAMAAESPQSM